MDIEQYWRAYISPKYLHTEKQILSVYADVNIKIEDENGGYDYYAVPISFDLSNYDYELCLNTNTPA